MTMSILVVEDDESKRAQINLVISRAVPSAHTAFARSYQSGLKSMIADQYDLLVLDMTMPTFDQSPLEPGGRVRPFAGRDLLEQLSRRRISFKAVVVTGFEILGEGGSQTTLAALNGELAEHFGGSYLGSIHYNPAMNEWESKLANLILAHAQLL